MAGRPACSEVPVGARAYKSGVSNVGCCAQEQTCPAGSARRLLALGVSSLRRTIMSLLEEQRTLIGTGTECIGRE